MFNTPWIEGVSFGDVEIFVKGKIEPGNVDIGAVTLENNGRKFMLDVSSYRHDGGIISCDLEVDTDTFPEEEFKYDLTKQDLLDINHGGKGTIFVSTEDELPIDKIELWATVDEKYTPFHLEVEE